MQHVAVVCARGLGDGLLSMILSHNLSLSGVLVTTFSTILCELREWFPSQKILPFPQPKDFKQTFAPFDTVIAADHSLIKEEHDFRNHLIILKERDFDKSLSMVDNLQQMYPNYEKKNGIVIPPGLKWRAHPKRVIIHPTSADPKKNWPAEKFIQLGQALEKEGYQPVFCVSPKEKDEWINLVPELPSFPTVHALACFVYESGSMIGNDSGIGHLASALNIPTISIFARKSYSRLWRPGWGAGVVVTPLGVLPGSHLKQKFWKKLLSVKRVVRAHKKLGGTLAHPTQLV